MKHRFSIAWFTEMPSPLGEIVLTATPAGLSGVYFRGQRWFPNDLGSGRREAAPFTAAQTWLRAYFAGAFPRYDAPLDPHGTDFQRAVWQELQNIPAGCTRTYGEIARAVGRPQAGRAVGAAIGRNPLSLIIPCHRVVGQNGSLTGYAGGLERKEFLLRLEGVR